MKKRWFALCMCIVMLAGILTSCGTNTGNNLLTWTKYTGYDPEVSTMSNAMTPGVDFGAYPRSRSFVFGVNVAF